jgi:hypothetical protein
MNARTLNRLAHAFKRTTGGIISKTRLVSASEFRLQDAFGGSIKLGPGFAPTIVKLDQWLSALVHSPDALLHDKALRANNAVALIAAIAGPLTDHARGLERDLLRKSIEEVLFSSAGKITDGSSDSIGKRIRRCVLARGESDVLGRFMTLHSFNTVWFRASDTLRVTAPSQEALESSLRKLQRSCKLVVASVWKSTEPRKTVALGAATELVSMIEAGLSVL